MRPLLALVGIASAIAAAGLLTASQADGARTSPVARTALERSIFHDQSSVGAVARPPFVVTKVRCVEAGEFCNVTRRTTTRRFTLVELLRVRIQRERGFRQWSYPGVDAAATTALQNARDGRLIWAISATTSIMS